MHVAVRDEINHNQPWLLPDRNTVHSQQIWVPQQRHNLTLCQKRFTILNGRITFGHHFDCQIFRSFSFGRRPLFRKPHFTKGTLSQHT